jgi:hypothetical protein
MQDPNRLFCHKRRWGGKVALSAGAAQTVPIVPLSVDRLPPASCASQPSAAARDRVPSRCGLACTEHGVSRPRRWCWEWEGRACLALTRHATLGAPHGRQRQTFFPEVTTIVLVVKRSERHYLTRKNLQNYASCFPLQNYASLPN